jgi:hypothetical protein
MGSYGNCQKALDQAAGRVRLFAADSSRIIETGIQSS